VATDFGDLLTAGGRLAACGSNTRGIFSNGQSGSPDNNTIEYVTIASTGNSTDFGDTISAMSWAAACSSTTRGVIGGGYTASPINVIQYVTIASTGNTTDFGDLTLSTSLLGSCSSSTRGLFAGGYITGAGSGDTNNIDYITIASVGNAIDFGDLTQGTSSGQTEGLGGASSSTRGLFFGGAYSGNVIQYVTIASTGNSASFGNLPAAFSGLGCTSNAHGGL
jgi:hypothetical protein